MNRIDDPALDRSFRNAPTSSARLPKPATPARLRTRSPCVGFEQPHRMA
jgi:hypothetical protein